MKSMPLYNLCPSPGSPMFEQRIQRHPRIMSGVGGAPANPRAGTFCRSSRSIGCSIAVSVSLVADAINPTVPVFSPPPLCGLSVLRADSSKLLILDGVQVIAERSESNVTDPARVSQVYRLPMNGRGSGRIFDFSDANDRAGGVLQPLWILEDQPDALRLIANFAEVNPVLSIVQIPDALSITQELLAEISNTAQGR